MKSRKLNRLRIVRNVRTCQWHLLHINMCSNSISTPQTRWRCRSWNKRFNHEVTLWFEYIIEYPLFSSRCIVHMGTIPATCISVVCPFGTIDLFNQFHVCASDMRVAFHAFSLCAALAAWNVHALMSAELIRQNPSAIIAAAFKRISQRSLALHSN